MQFYDLKLGDIFEIDSPQAINNLNSKKFRYLKINECNWHDSQRNALNIHTYVLCSVDWEQRVDYVGKLAIKI